MVKVKKPLKKLKPPKPSAATLDPRLKTAQPSKGFL
jgi:hypothetical protein